jgi:hypothetical protein
MPVAVGSVLPIGSESAANQMNHGSLLFASAQKLDRRVIFRFVSESAAAISPRHNCMTPLPHPWMNQRLPSAQKLMLLSVMVIKKMNNREHRSVISLDRSAFFNKCFSFYPIWFVTYSAHILQNITVTEGVETIGAGSPTSGSVENELLDEVIFLTILQNI